MTLPTWWWANCQLSILGDCWKSRGVWPVRLTRRPEQQNFICGNIFFAKSMCAIRHFPRYLGIWSFCRHYEKNVMCTTYGIKGMTNTNKVQQLKVNFHKVWNWNFCQPEDGDLFLTLNVYLFNCSGELFMLNWIDWWKREHIIRVIKGKDLVKILFHHYVIITLWNKDQLIIDGGSKYTLSYISPQKNIVFKYLDFHTSP